jgi:ATP-binding cassette subfamily A (ABC1) protein 3
MLKLYKKDRIIILTTHYMDEADILGDRIGIMSRGKMKCLGTSVFLKNKFGVGFNLTAVKTDCDRN